ncbi:hypothetical protein ACF0H5_013024 [Mactra antiquata]
MNPSDRETRAIFLNFKEIRNLERNVQSLDGEKSYYVSLINLDQKIVKVHYKRLKDKVSKIKSHLSQDEIHELKNLDDAGSLPTRPKSSRLDSSLKIEAAERRLKLMPRAKSATPRLVNRPTTAQDTMRRLKSPSIVRTTTRPLTSPAARSTSSLNLRIPSRSAKSASCHSQHRVITRRALSSDDEDISTYNPVPSSLRRERKQSIYVDATDQNTENNPPALKQTSPRLNNSLTIPRTSSFGSRSNISIDKSTRKVRSTSTASSNVEIKIELVDNDDLCEDKNNHSDSKVTSNEDKTSNIGIQKTNDNNSTELLALNTNESGHHCDNITTLETVTTEENKHVIDTLNVKNDSTDIKTLTNDDFTQVETLVVPDLTNTVDVSSPTLKPTTPSATKTTDFTKTQTTEQLKITSYQRAQETRKKSIMNIRKASALLAEGKTRTPFNCHEVTDDNNKEKPFRSIREGALACTDIDREILDSTMGDDLHKEIKKGMLLGEVATSLYLEDKIDHFLDKVDGYVKENPNYVYDPDVTRAELLQKAREAKAAKPKRNRLRRRQLERRLAECDINEMKKSRWLRHEDDQLDNTGVNTLVIDQMKMLSKLKFSYDSD